MALCVPLSNRTLRLNLDRFLRIDRQVDAHLRAAARQIDGFDAATVGVNQRLADRQS